jgi:hypothetical protein
MIKEIPGIANVISIVGSTARPSRTPERRVMFCR